MVLGPKQAIQHVPSKGRISIKKIQNFTVHKRQSVVRTAYGLILIILAVVLATVKPIDIITNWIMDIKEGKFLVRMWEAPTYEVFSDVYIFNYTNLDSYLSGGETVLHLEEIGPFRFREIRTNENMTIDKELGVMTMKPKSRLEFLPEESIADDHAVQIVVPNTALLAISTILADSAGYFVNAGAYYSMTAIGTKLSRNLTANELLWGYEDPLVSLASKLLPGWIDFGKVGILDRFYAPREEEVVVEIRDKSKQFSIVSWNQKTGLEEQGFTDWNTSTPCNQIKGTYEALMLPTGLEKGSDLTVFRKQACRTYPYRFGGEMKNDIGFNFYRYIMKESAFNKTSPFACGCDRTCVPDGFIDISSCYYGFPIALSKPHFLDVDPVQQTYFKGLSPDPEKHRSYFDIEPSTGAVLAASTNIQINIAVRTSAGNPITRPLKDKVIPIMWFSLFCKEAPPEVLTLLWIRLVLAPPLIITLIIIFLVFGMFLGIQGFYRFCRPKYKLVQHEPQEKIENVKRKKSTVILNVTQSDCFVDEADLAKEAVFLLAVREKDGDGTPHLLPNY